MEIRAFVRLQSFFHSGCFCVPFCYMFSRPGLAVELHTFFQAHLSEGFVLSLDQLYGFALTLRLSLCVKRFYLLSSAFPLSVWPTQVPWLTQGATMGEAFSRSRLPQTSSQFFGESLNLDFPEEVASHSELNRTIRNFGFLATSFDQLDQWLESHGLLDFGSGTHADLRCLWHRSHALACSEGQTAAVPFPPQSPALPLPQDQSFSSASDPSRTVSAAASWNEPFPAKLSSDKTAELRAAFLRKYPSEVLDDSTMPSARLLALAFKQASSQEWRFIPWRWRMSVLELEEQQLQRPRKLARTELADLILDDIPSRNLPDTLGMFALSKILHLHSVAMAMVTDVHLVTLKKYESTFLRFASARFDTSSGLRPPNALECEQADRRFWEAVSELRLQGWSLDDCIHENTAVRSELASLLAPRVFLPKAMLLGGKGNSSGAGFGNGRGRGKGKGDGRGRGSGLGTGRGGSGLGNQGNSAGTPTNRQEWASSAKINGEVKTLCMRWSQRTGCKNPSCRFEHLCPVKLPSGKICLGNHPAWQHTDTPH